jgi:hypothetical protein
MIKKDARFRYEVLQQKHVPQVTEIFTRAFCDDEPMTHHLNMQYDTYTEFARAVASQSAEDGFSIVALDGHRVVACGLSEDLADVKPIPIDFDPNFKYILHLLDSLGAAFFPGKVFPKKHIAHLFITAVDKDYRHLGLSTQINFRAMDLAASLGFEFMYCELTNYFNEKGIMHHLKNTKKLIGSQMYDDFTTENVRPFAGLAGGANSYLWEIVHHPLLTYSTNDITQQIRLK